MDRGPCTIKSALSRRRLQGSVAIAGYLALALGAALASDSVGAAEKRAGFPPPSHGSPAEVWAVGDGADGSDAAKALANEIESNNPDRFLYLGDVYPVGSMADFNNRYDPVYGRFDTITAPTMGNHEWGNRKTGYRPYWKDATGASRIPNYFSTQIAGWQILSLNSEAPHGPDSDQVRWLRQQISGNPQFGNCRIAFWHRPRYNAGSHEQARDTEPFWDILAHDARFILAGHDHNMQRFEPRRGIVQFVSGAGGHAPYSVDGGDKRLEFHNDSTRGALRLRLDGEEAGFAFVSTGGNVLNAGQRQCDR